MLPSKESRSSTAPELCVSWKLLLPLLSGLLYSVLSADVKYLTLIPPEQLYGYRSWAVASLALPQLVHRKENIIGLPGYRILVMIMSFAAATAMLLHFIVFRLLPLGEASVLISTYPAFISIAAKIFLNEPLGPLQLISAALSVMGMILVTGVYETAITRTRVYTTSDIYGFAAAIIAVGLITLQAILLRRLRNIHHSVSMFVAGVLGVLESAIAVAITGNFSLYCSIKESLLILLMGVLGYLVLLFTTLAYQKIEAGIVSVIRSSSDIFFAFIWQIMIFQDIPGSTEIIGAVLVCLSIVLISFSKQILRLRLCFFQKNV